MPTTIMASLKQATAASHSAVERALDLMRPKVSLSDYGNYLERMLGIHVPFERQIFARDDVRHVIPDLDTRRKVPLLESDLAALGLSSQRVRVSRLTIASTAHALGALYVLEGSTLGGKLIARHVRRALGDAIAHTYLDAYGSEVGERWRQFGAAMQTWSGSESEVIAGANAMFSHIAWWCTADRAAA